MLGPRLAFACKGTAWAWAQAKTLDPVKLTDLEKAVGILLSVLASLEESADIKTYEILELALYKAMLKADEIWTSYKLRRSTGSGFQQEIPEPKIAQIKASMLLRQNHLQHRDKEYVFTTTSSELAPDKVDTAMQA